METAFTQKSSAINVPLMCSKNLGQPLLFANAVTAVRALKKLVNKLSKYTPLQKEQLRGTGLSARPLARR